MEVLEVIKKAEEAVAARRLIESGWNETASELAAHRASRAISARTYRLGLLALRESGAPVRLLAAAPAAPQPTSPRFSRPRARTSSASPNKEGPGGVRATGSSKYNVAEGV